MDNKKKTIIALVVLVVVAIIAGYAYYWKNTHKPVTAPSTSQGAASVTESATLAAETVTQSATQGVLPSIGTVANPLENKPVVNPVDVSNPFKSVKTNPFQ
jgi:flagellar basal body-associated protein FliL